MKNFVISVLTLIFCYSYAMADWYEGGNLHNSTINQWRSATYKNKLATAGDWTSAMLGQNAVRDYGLDGIKIISANMVSCIDEVAKDKSNDSLKSNEIAAICFMMLK